MIPRLPIWAWVLLGCGALWWWQRGKADILWGDVKIGGSKPYPGVAPGTDDAAQLEKIIAEASK